MQVREVIFHLGAQVIHIDGMGDLDIGSLYSDSTKFTNAVCCRPEGTMRDGLRWTIDHDRAHLPKYLETGA